MGSAVPSRVSLLIPILRLNLLLISGIPPEFPGGVHQFILNRRTPSEQSRAYRVTQLRTDGVHCRESAGTAPAVLKVVRVASVAFPGITMDQLMCVCVCVLSSHSFWTSSSLDVPAGATQEEGHTGFLIHLSAVRALISLARRIQPFLSLVDYEVESCVLTI